MENEITISQKQNWNMECKLSYISDINYYYMPIGGIYNMVPTVFRIRDRRTQKIIDFSVKIKEECVTFDRKKGKRNIY